MALQAARHSLPVRARNLQQQPQLLAVCKRIWQAEEVCGGVIVLLDASGDCLRRHQRLLVAELARWAGRLGPYQRLVGGEAGGKPPGDAARPREASQLGVLAVAHDREAACLGIQQRLSSDAPLLQRRLRVRRPPGNGQMLAQVLGLARVHMRDPFAARQIAMIKTNINLKFDAPAHRLFPIETPAAAAHRRRPHSVAREVST